jgi:hypothetical protein
MTWFIVQCKRETWTKYVVEAEDEDAALEASDDWRYWGYVDGEDAESTIVGGPFESDEKALADIVSYVES